MRARVWRWALRGLLLWSGSCSVVSAQDASIANGPVAPTASPATVSAPPAAPVRRPPPTWTLDVKAPDHLADLLNNYLDLARFQNEVKRQSLATSSGANSPDPAVAPTISRSELRRLVSAAPDQARSLLEAEGHFQADVKVTMAEEVPGQPIAITMVVEPGPRAEIAKVQLVFEGELDNLLGQDDLEAVALAATLQDNFLLAPGERFRQALWSQAKSATLATLRAQGYAGAVWSGTSATVDAQTHQAKLFLVADSGPLFRFGDLEIEGLVRQPDWAIHHLANFRRGETFKERRLLDFQERLQKLNLFDTVLVTLDDDPAKAAAAPVRVQVKESALQQAIFGAGVSSDTGPRVSVEHLHRLLWGWPVQARTKAQLGRDESLFQSDLTSHPRPGFKRWLGALQVARQIDDADAVTLSGRVRFGQSDEGDRMERLVYAEYQRARVTSAQDLVVSEASALTGMRQWLWKDVDSTVLPTRGLTANVSLGAGRSFSTLDRSGLFGRGHARLTWYRPLPARWYATVRGEVGHVQASDAVDVPDTLLFRAGGDESVRGYGHRSLGVQNNSVTLGGKALWTSSVELAHPLLDRIPGLWGALFVDAGDAAERWSSIETRLGYGVGVRWRSPVGPLRLDAAYGQDVRAFRLHFSVGIAL